MIHIITGHSEHLNKMTSLTHPFLRKYADKHNLKLTIHDIPTDYQTTHRPYSWFKVNAILDSFKDDTNKFTVWVDADTLIINQDFDLHSLIVPDKHFYVSMDFNNLNCGIMMWSNNDYSKEILNKVWSMDEYINNCWWEQAAIIDLYTKNYNMIRKYTQLVPQNIFNAYEYRAMNVIEGIIKEQWDRGQITEQSWILHMPSLSMKQRLSLIKDYINLYKLDAIQ
jgi:hypothetical protein